VVIEVPRRLPAGPVTLRPLQLSDAEAYAQAFADDPQLGRLIGIEPDPTVRRAREHVTRVDGRAAAGSGLELAVAAGAGDFVGSVAAYAFIWTHRRCEVGFWLVPAARHRGLGAVAVARLLDWIFDELPIDRVEMTTTPDNAATRTLARRLGFTEEGVQRKRNVERGRRVDLVLFGLLVSDWRTRTIEIASR
jgi:ribosomal-protein-serine acetyltransferase